MSTVCSDPSNSTIGDHLKWRKPRNQSTKRSTTDPNPQIPSLIQTTRCKSAISSLLLSTFTTTTTTNNNNNNNNNHENTHKNTTKKCTKGSTLLGFGCTAQPEVSVPGLIRSSAGWEERRENDKNKQKKMKNECNNKKKRKKKKTNSQQLQGVMMMEGSGVGVQDFWCGADSAAAASVDCVRPLSSRGKIDLDKLHHREHGSCSYRQRVNNEHYSGMDLNSALGIGPDVFEARYYHHLRNRSPDELAEVLMFQNGLLMRRSGGLDRYRDWRLDVDNMTYEELIELGERIGHVNTGLGEDQIGRCLRKLKLSVLDELSSQSHEPEGTEGKCSICQEEYEADEEMGKLECGHSYHLHCIKEWLARRNACPICKVEASSQ